MKKYWIMVLVVLILFGVQNGILESQDTRQRHFLTGPFSGQSSNFSDWVINEKYLSELTNAYVDETGVIQQRPGFYCYMDSVSTTEPILGAYNYKKWIEGGATSLFVTNTNEKIYYTQKAYGNTNTAISGDLTFSDDGIPVWLNHYNNLYMANGEDNPVMWDQDANVIQMGRCTYSGAATFEDSNEIVIAVSFESGAYHFRTGWDIIIADSNNNGTYEIASVDANVIGVQTTAGASVTWTYEEADVAVTLTGIGYPSELTTSRSESVTYTKSTTSCISFYQDTIDYIAAYQPNFIEAGFRAGMTLTVSGSVSNDGDYTIGSISRIKVGSRYVNYLYITGAWAAQDTCDESAVTLTGTLTITNANAFNPATITGHKSRLFAGGVKEFPTYLFYSVSRLYSASYYDLWRDRVLHDDGSGYIDLQDKIMALIGDWKNNLVILCENKSMALSGDDPGFDILTPSQVLVYHPEPISSSIGIVGPNAYCEADGDIYFLARSGLQKLSMVAEGGGAKYTTESLPVSDLINDILQTGNSKRISMQYLKDMNLILINCALTEGSNDSILAYNLANKSWSKWTFTDGSEPNCLFQASGPEIDPNETDVPNDNPNPYDTVWMGSQDGKLWALTKVYCYDRDYEDPNGTENNIAATITTAKLNMDDPWQTKLFRRAVVLASPQVNYATTSGGAFGLYYKVDDGSWSSAVTKTFSTHTDTAGTAIDYYQFADSFGLTGVKNEGHVIQYKITTSGATSRFGLSLMGILTEWEPTLRFGADI